MSSEVGDKTVQPQREGSGRTLTVTAARGDGGRPGTSHTLASGVAMRLALARECAGSDSRPMLSLGPHEETPMLPSALPSAIATRGTGRAGP